MDFGKLPSVEKVDFSLPAEPAGNATVLAGLEKPGTPVLYVGPTGYNMKPWVGRWYPPGAQEKSFLKHYGTQFNTIEFNTTHYRIPDTETVRRWKEAVPDDFRFCPKIPQTVSHARDLGLSGGEMAVFCDHILHFEANLGCCFMQLPPQFAPIDQNILARFLGYFSAKIPLAIEVRHPAFFKASGEAEAFFELLKKTNTAAVITDVAGRRDVCHMRLTNARTLVRFVGNSDQVLYDGDRFRVSAWAERLSRWFENGLHEAYFFTHEPDNLLGPELTEYCCEVFGRVMPGVTLRGPRPVAGQQGSLF